MNTYQQELLTEIAKIMQKKYMHMNETLRLTKEMADGLARDDKVTTEMLMKMRGEEMEAMGTCEKSIHLLLEGADESVRTEMISLLKGKITENMKEDVLAGNLVNIVQNTSHVLKQTIEIDKHMSCRVAGAESFYNG